LSDQLHAPAALSQGKSLWYPLDRRLGGPQSRSGQGILGIGRKQDWCIYAKSNSGRQVHGQSLYWLTYHDLSTKFTMFIELKFSTSILQAC